MAVQTPEGLLTGVLSPREKAVSRLNEGISMAQLQPGKAAVALAPTRRDAASTSLGNLFGLDMRSPQEQVAQQVSQLLSSGNIEDAKKAAQLLVEAGDNAGAMKLANAIKTEEDRLAQAGVTQNNLNATLEAARRAYPQDFEVLEPLLRTGMPLKEAVDSINQGGTQQERIVNQIMRRDPTIPMLVAQRVARDMMSDPAGEAPVHYVENEGKVYALQNGQLVNTVDIAPDATAQEAQALTTRLYNVERDLDLVNELYSMTDETTVGFGNYTAAGVPRTNARAHAAKVSTLKARLTVEVMNELRAASKASGSSGTGLGQITEREIKLMEDKVAALDPLLDPEQFKQQLDDIRYHYENVRNGLLGKVPEINWEDPIYEGTFRELDGKHFLINDDGTYTQLD